MIINRLSPVLSYAAAVPVTQTANTTFKRVLGLQYDEVASLKGLAKSTTTDLSINLSLQAGENYNLASSLAGLPLGATASLVDASGNSTALDLKNPFSVSSSGQYQLLLSNRKGVKAMADNLTVQGHFLSQKLNLGFANSAAKTGPDLLLKLSAAGIGQTTTKASVNVALRAGVDYSFLLGSGATPNVSLTDGSGNSTSLDTTKTFQVDSDGQYTLGFSGSAGSLAAALKSTTITGSVTAQSIDLPMRHGGGSLAGIAIGRNVKEVTLNLNLTSGISYNFSMANSDGFNGTVIDSLGNANDIRVGSSFSVAASGSSKLVLTAKDELPPYLQPMPIRSALSNATLRGSFSLPNSSGDANVDALIRGGTLVWASGMGDLKSGTEQVSPLGAKSINQGTAPQVITYSFLTGAIGSAADKNGFKQMTVTQKSAVRKAFAYYSQLINVTFKEVAGNGAGDINLGTNKQPQSGGWSYYPNAGPASGRVVTLLGNNWSCNDGAGVQPGGYGWETIVHELGHALGLKHPGNYNALGGGSVGPYLPDATDNNQYSIMSYHENAATNGVNTSTAMQYDIEALQYLYGANKTGSTAVDGSFAFTGANSYVETLYSKTGTDKIDLSATTKDSVVDLNAGSFSSINQTTPLFPGYYSGNNNVAIAYGSTINRVQMSAQSEVKDTVVLNSAYASGGYDTIDSIDSNDKIALKASLFGSLASANVTLGNVAQTASDKILLDTSTGSIFYDADANGNGAAVKIAQYSLANGSGQLTASNFSFVA